MVGDVVGRQRPGVPALVAVLNRDAGSFELSQHLMRDRAADVVVLGESAFVQKETPIDEPCRDRMFDRTVDVVTAAANLARFGEPGRQFETCLPQVQPAGLGRAAPAPLHEVAAPLEIRNEAFLAKQLQSYRGRARGWSERLSPRSDSPNTRPSISAPRFR